MSQNRFRQIARLENAARPYIGMRNRIEHQCSGARGNFCIFHPIRRSKIGEPSSCAWQRLQDTEVSREYCRKWDEMKIAHLRKLHGESTQYHQSFIPRNHHTSRCPKRVLRICFMR
jgi:hypothetical protein